MKKLDRELSSKYDLVWERYAQSGYFDVNQLEKSRELFDELSIQKGKPETKFLDVYAMIGGLPFDTSTKTKLCRIQKDICLILENRLSYFVESDCLAVEFCVLKWPSETIAKSILNDAMIELNKFSHPSFNLKIQGVQIHTDGCIVARGYDEGYLRNIRRHFQSSQVISVKTVTMGSYTFG